MMVENYFDTYKEELELVDTQNRVELDLYSIIANLIRSAKSAKHISLRDVSGRRETDFSGNIWEIQVSQILLCAQEKKVILLKFLVQ